jgi:hypothetical protein
MGISRHLFSPSLTTFRHVFSKGSLLTVCSDSISQKIKEVQKGEKSPRAGSAPANEKKVFGVPLDPHIKEVKIPLLIAFYVVVISFHLCLCSSSRFFGRSFLFSFRSSPHPSLSLSLSPLCPSLVDRKFTASLDSYCTRKVSGVL